MEVLIKFIAVLFIVGCANTPTFTPHFLDTQLEEMREYKVIDKKAMTIQFKEAHPITFGADSYGNGFFCIPPTEARLWKEWCVKNKCGQ